MTNGNINNNFFNNNHNINRNTSSVLSTNASGDIIQEHNTDCYIGSATALLKNIKKDDAINIAKFIKLREKEQGILGMYQNEIIDIIKNIGKIDNAYFDNSKEITDFNELKNYVRPHHKNGFGGFYSISNKMVGGISHAILLGFDKDGNFLLIDRQKNSVTEMYGYFFYEKDIYNIYWENYNKKEPILITTVKFGDITKKFELLNLEHAMNFDENQLNLEQSMNFDKN